MRSSRHPVAIACLLLIFALPTARAEDRIISVNAVGVAKAKPVAAEVTFSAAGNAELMTDAVSKFQDASRRITKACEALKIANLRIEPGGITIGQTAPGSNPFMNQAADDSPTAQISLSRALVITIPLGSDAAEDQVLESISKLLDAARDAGAGLSNGNDRASMLARVTGQQQHVGVSFIIEDADGLRDASLKNALEMAHKRATQLATLAGCKLGEVVGIDDAAASASNENQWMSMVYGMASSEAEEPDTRLRTSKFAEVQVRSHVRVRYALVSGSE